MTQPQVALYGTWKSPLTSGMFATEKTRLDDIVLDGSDIYWIECRTPDGNTIDKIPPPYNARTRVHE